MTYFKTYSIIIIALSMLISVRVTAQPHFSQERLITNTEAQGVAEILIMDADGTGNLDIVSMNPGSNNIVFFPNQGNMGFNSARNINSDIPNLRNMTAGIINNRVNIYSSNFHGIGVHENLGSGSYLFLVIQKSLNNPYNDPLSLTLADVDGDGNMDLVFIERMNNLNSNIHIIFSIGNSSSASYLQLSIGGVADLAATDLAVADINGNGRLDLVFGSGTTGNIHWISNNGNRNFGSPAQISSAMAGFRKISAADFGNNGHVDLIVMRNNRIQLVENFGNGTFIPTSSEVLISNARDFKLGDMNNNGMLDVVVAGDGNINLIPNNGSGRFGTPNTISHSGASAIALGDLRGDGDLDIAAAITSENKIVVFENYTVSSSTQPPVANDNFYSTDQGVELVVSAENGILSNDFHPEGFNFIISDLIYASHGEINLMADGSFTYIPNPGFWGEDSFSYVIEDDFGKTDDATVTIEVEQTINLPSPPYETGDLVNYNGSFQNSRLGSTTDEFPWRLNSLEGAVANFEIVTESQDADNRAIKITIGNTFNNGEDWNIEVVNEQINIAEGDIYELSLWMKADSDSRVANIYLGLPEEGGYIRIYNPVLAVGTEWQKYTYQFLADSFSASTGIRFGSSFNFQENAGATFHMDNVTVTKIADTSDLPSPPYDIGEEILFNGSFEKTALGITRFLFPWTVNSQNRAFATYEVVTDAQDDDRAVKVTLNSGFNGGPDWNVELVNKNIKVQAGDIYEASVWLKADSDRRIANFFLGLTQSGGYERLMQETVALSTGWQEFTFDFEAEANAETHDIRLGSAFNFEGNAGGTIYMDNLSLIKTAGSTSTEKEGSEPVEFVLQQNYPNPFNPTTSIGFQLSESSEVTLKVYDMLGREVASLVSNTRMNPGTHTVTFNAANLSSGVYMYRLDAGEISETRMMMFMK